MKELPVEKDIVVDLSSNLTINDSLVEQKMVTDLMLSVTVHDGFSGRQEIVTDLMSSIIVPDQFTGRAGRNNRIDIFNDRPSWIHLQSIRQ